jgi:ribosomal protein S14
MTIFKKLIRKDYKNRLKYLVLEVEYKILKSIACNKILPLNLRLKAFHNLNFNNATKIRNICILTGRTRGIITKYGVSRFMFRQFADNGFITGLKRAS